MASITFDGSTLKNTLCFYFSFIKLCYLVYFFDIKENHISTKSTFKLKLKIGILIFYDIHIRCEDDN